MTKPRIETGSREEVTVLCRLIGTRGHVIVKHPPFCLSPPKGGSNLHLRLLYVASQRDVKDRVLAQWKDSLVNQVRLCGATRDIGSACCASLCHSVTARLPTRKTRRTSPSRHNIPLPH